MLWMDRPIIVAIGPTPKHTEKSITQMIVGIARTNEEKPEIMFFIMLFGTIIFMLNMANGKENKTLIIVVKKARARLTQQDFNSEKIGMLEI